MEPNALKRKEALLIGVPTYYTKDCKRGHSSGRYTSNGNCIQCVKDFATANPSVNREAVTRYQAKNKDKVKRVLKSWRNRNPDKVKNQKYMRRTAEGFFTKEDIHTLLEKQRGCCNGCDKEFTAEFKYEIDHIFPISKGGSNWPTNLQLLCRSCNARKSAKIP